ncbi:MAG: FtsX-like permease family protein [Defluviitaleaceae bacterium]|nr:FtsX-like permease family protein [Defluviitaleaceae bacterium]
MIFGANVQSRFLNPRNQNVRDPWMMGMMGVENTVDLLGQPLRMSYRPEFGQPSPPGGAPTGGTAAVRPYIVEGRGILASSDDWMASNSIFMPLDQLLQIQADEQEWRDRENMGGGGGGMIFMGDGGMMIANDPEGFRQIIALVDHPNNIQTVVDDLIAMGINENSMWFEAQLVLSQMESTRTLQNLLLATGIVSLVVAAIGIANTMIMSIYERTKEIGVMKVIGASVKDVRRLFLLEAAFIGAIGGLVGLAASAGVSYALNNAGNIDLFGGGLPPWMQMDTAGSIVSFIPQWLYLLALIFSVAVGLISGFLPARRATRISALAAIKTE